MHNSPPIVLGIDPGFGRVGWAVVQVSGSQAQLLDCGCIETSKQLTRFARYQQIEQHMTVLLEQYHPQLAGIEQLYSARNTTTVIPVAEARGVIIGCLLRHQVKIHELNPSTVKSTVTGNGRADKVAMRKMVLLQLGNVSAQFKAKVEKTLDDTIDAIGIALTAATVRSSV